jgi:DNA (cytosine-5)-methyltransferase 1
MTISFPWQQGGGQHGGLCEEHTMPLTKNQTLAVQQTMQVRRLTPRECERLQGFPDDYTLIPYRGKPASDGPRYKALGNSMAVPVMRWIGQRIQEVSQHEDG